MWNSITSLSEDCLYLNMWVPQHKSSEHLAVIVWIHGGSFTTGATSLVMYDGAYMAASQHLIVASMQYRVGSFGFLYFGTQVCTPILCQANNVNMCFIHYFVQFAKMSDPIYGHSVCTQEAPGNMGHMDQQLALKWIALNAAVFGGDPTRVTLWGQSNGAASVGFHLLSPGSDPYFQNVVMESGSPLRCATD